MKAFLLFFLILNFHFTCLSQNVGIGTNSPNANAILDISDSSKGILIPRMDSTQRKNIPNTKGLLVFDTTTNCFWFNVGTSWVNIPQGGLTKGDMLYWNAFQWQIIPSGQYGKALFMCNGVPTWGGCPPLLTTNTISTITSSTATSGGTISNDGGNPITVRGICWDTISNPTIELLTKTNDGSGVGTFISSLSNLITNKTYYVRSYATNSIGTSYGNEVSFTTTQSFTIGQSFGGGVIFYVDVTGQHGLIAAANDQSTSVKWWNGSNIDVLNTSAVLGDGLLNTNKIINAQGAGTYAATICRNYHGGGFTDWYLPNGEELYELYLKKDIIGGFSTEFYWSSEQRDLSTAYIKYFLNGTLTFNNKSVNAYVRAIRSF